MERYLPVLKKCSLFAGIDDRSLTDLLACLGATVQSFGKNGQILSEGEQARDIGIMLTGKAHITTQDIYGNRNLLAQLEPGALFAESFACADVGALPVSVTAAEPCQVMRIDCRRITVGCSNACGFHSQLILNLLKAVARHNLEFHRKLEILSKRTTREKLMAYLLSCAKEQGSREFTIPYDRQALADYLGVERSAMSAELSKLQKQGVLRTDRSNFVLL